MPSDMANVIASLGVAGEALGIGDATAVDTSPKKVRARKADDCVDEDTGPGGVDAWLTTEAIERDVEEAYEN